MTKMFIQIEETLQQRLAHRAAESGFATVEEYVEALVRADAGDDDVVDDDIEQLLLDRLDDAGEGIEVTPEFIEDFKRQIEQRRAGKKSTP